MIILGISTSSKFASAAVMKPRLKKDAVVSFCYENGQRTGRSHSEILMELIDKAISDADVKINELDAVAVDVGPGSFTGLRIGVSCANALAYALDTPVLPVCSLTAMCLGDDFFISKCVGDDRFEADGDDGVDVIHAALIDCRNGNCYAAAYDGERREVIAPSAAVTKEVLEQLQLPEKMTLFAGDALDDKHKDFYSYPNAKQVLIAAQRLGIQPVKQAVPMYLRPSQAERMKKD